MTSCIEIWGSATRTHLNCLFLQKQIITIIHDNNTRGCQLLRVSQVLKRLVI